MYDCWDNRQSRAEFMAERRRMLVALFGCQDCGAKAGKECKPEYGCKDSSRRPEARPVDPAREQLDAA